MVAYATGLIFGGLASLNIILIVVLITSLDVTPAVPPAPPTGPPTLPPPPPPTPPPTFMPIETPNCNAGIVEPSDLLVPDNITECLNRFAEFDPVVWWRGAEHKIRISSSPSGDKVAVTYHSGFGRIFSAFGDYNAIPTIPVAVSTDFGESFTEYFTPTTFCGGADLDSDQGLRVVHPDVLYVNEDLIIQTYAIIPFAGGDSMRQVEYTVSTDAGVSWSPPEMIGEMSTIGELQYPVLTRDGSDVYLAFVEPDCDGDIVGVLVTKTETPAINWATPVLVLDLTALPKDKCEYRLTFAETVIVNDKKVVGTILYEIDDQISRIAIQEFDNQGGTNLHLSESLGPGCDVSINDFSLSVNRVAPITSMGDKLYTVFSGTSCRPIVGYSSNVGETWNVFDVAPDAPGLFVFPQIATISELDLVVVQAYEFVNPSSLDIQSIVYVLNGDLSRRLATIVNTVFDFTLMDTGQSDLFNDRGDLLTSAFLLNTWQGLEYNAVTQTLLITYQVPGEHTAAQDYQALVDAGLEVGPVTEVNMPIRATVRRLCLDDLIDLITSQDPEATLPIELPIAQPQWAQTFKLVT